jgi:hypothetical protein
MSACDGGNFSALDEYDALALFMWRGFFIAPSFGVIIPVCAGE